MNILIVKLSSLGDVVHAMPAVQDLLQSVPEARIDWVVERGFAPLVQRCRGVRQVIPSDLRSWRKAPLAASTRRAWREFRAQLGADRYDAILDLQGLTKSALVSRLARLAAGGKRYAMANRTEGSSWEAPTRWAADVAVRLDPHVHAVTRARLLCARALGYPVPQELRFGLEVTRSAADPAAPVVLVHGTSREDKCWPEPDWIELGRRLAGRGHRLALPHGNEAERARSERMAQAIGPAAIVWPRLPLDQLLDRLAASAGLVGVDSGLSHIAVALGLPHVQLYNFDTAWRTGPLPHPRQCSLFAQPAPALEAVWAAWERITMRP